MISADTPGPHCSRRQFEWTMAIAMSLFGLHHLLVPGALVNSRYSAVLLVLTATQFSFACVMVGLTRILVLVRNGQWPEWGPRIRALAALCAMAIWAQLAVALWQPASGSSSAGMWVYLTLAASELRSVIRARRDGNGL
jgi:hypothetical protein